MENNKIEFQLHLKKNNEITNIIYNISIDLISKLIVFSLESDEIPKKLIHKGYSYSDMITNYIYFSNKEYFKDTESIYCQLKIYLENAIKNSSIELIEEEVDKIALKMPTLLSYAPFIKFVFLNKINAESAILELSELYKTLKKEKEKEIDSLNKKINENEKKYDALQKEVSLLRKEIINLKDTQTKKLKAIENNFNRKIQEINDEKENMKSSFENNLSDLQKGINEKYDSLKETMQTIQSNTRTQLIYLVLSNNSQNFKAFLENYFKLLKEESNSSIFNDDHKNSYNIVVDLLNDGLNGKNGTDSEKIIEYHEKDNNYKEYNDESWNWFLISNVIHQMLFNNNDEIQLNKNGVSQTLKKIYKLKPYFKKNFKSKLEKAKADIEDYVDGYKLGDIIKAIKIYKK